VCCREAVGVLEMLDVLDVSEELKVQEELEVMRCVLLAVFSLSCRKSATFSGCEERVPPLALLLTTSARTSFLFRVTASGAYFSYS